MRLSACFAHGNGERPGLVPCSAFCRSSWRVRKCCADDQRHDRCVGDAHARNAIRPEFGIGHGVAIRSHTACADRMEDCVRSLPLPRIDSFVAGRVPFGGDRSTALKHASGSGLDN